MELEGRQVGGHQELEGQRQERNAAAGLSAIRRADADEAYGQDGGADGHGVRQGNVLQELRVKAGWDGALQNNTYEHFGLSCINYLQLIIIY